MRLGARALRDTGTKVWSGLGLSVWLLGLGPFLDDYQQSVTAGLRRSSFSLVYDYGMLLRFGKRMFCKTVRCPDARHLRQLPTPSRDASARHVLTSAAGIPASVLRL